jgi:hypothetical protein
MTIYEENRLMSLLKDFDSQLFFDYLVKIRNLRECLEKEHLDLYFESIYDQTLSEPIAFRLKLSDPVLLMLSHPLCRLHARILYPIEYDWERFWVTKLGILPVYFINLNKISVIKFWGEEAYQASTDALNLLPVQEGTFLQVVPGARGIDYSTMNFIIHFGSPLIVAPPVMNDFLRNYLKYAYWNNPKRGFSCCPHFFHTRNSIKYFLKVAKTICLIDEVNGTVYIHVLDKVIKAKKTRIKILVTKDNQFLFTKVFAYIPEDVLIQLEKEELKQRFLNAIILEVREKDHSFELLSVVSDIGRSYYDLVQTLTSYILISTYYKNNSVSISCNMEELKRKFSGMLNQVIKHVRLPYTISDAIENVFEIAMAQHEPLFIVDNDIIRFLHPLALIYLFRTGRFELTSSSNRAKLIRFLDYLEAIRTSSRRIQLYIDERLDEIALMNKKQVLEELIRLTHTILISKLLYNYF